MKKMPIYHANFYLLETFFIGPIILYPQETSFKDSHLIPWGGSLVWKWKNKYLFAKTPYSLRRFVGVLQRHLEETDWEILVHLGGDPEPWVQSLTFYECVLKIPSSTLLLASSSTLLLASPEVGVSAANTLHHRLHQLLAEVKQEVAILGNNDHNSGEHW